MQIDWTTLITTVIGGIVVLIVEYFILKPDPTERKKLWTALALSISLFLPLFLFQLISAEFVAATMKQRPEVERVDWYANLYAVFAMLWGLFWGTKVRPWLRGSP